MRSRRFEAIALAAMLFAALAFIVSLQSNSSASSASAAVDAQQVDDIPRTFNYQGFLRNPDGSLMSGSYKVTLTIYDTATGDGNTLQHSETISNVVVHDGMFNVVLGDATPLPADFGNTAPIYIGVRVDDGAELIPRQRVHPVPWALLADTAMTLVPDASVERLTLNGETRITGNTAIGGDTNIDGDLTVLDQPPVKVLRYTNKTNNSTWNTGISADVYTCTMAGWKINMDIDEGSAGNYARWLSINFFSRNWQVEFYNWVNGSNSIPVSVDVICFKNEITEVETFSSASETSDVTPDNAMTDPASSLEEVGQGQ